MKKIACVGILVADVMTKPVDEIPGKGLLGQVDAIELYSGGNGMTAAVNLSRMATPAMMVGKIGTDTFGRFLAEKLEENGVDIRGLCRDAKTQTATSVVLSASDGERTFLHCEGTNGTLCLDDINWDIIAEADIVFLTGTFLMKTFDRQAVDFLKKCKEMGKTTVLDVCWDARGLWGTLLTPAMPYIDYFMPSLEEAQMLSGKTEPDDIADTFFANGVKHVVIKLGSKGAYLRENPTDKATVVPSYRVKAVDTTGAGDSFCSGFLACLARGIDFLQCGRFANAVGAHCVMAKGATTGIKTFEEMWQFMENYNK